ncbi:MAG: nicotinate (nicotinamide) nucleotide adenylyltransferase [Solobacterium sp.]|nr:nicotinate (nicotinamide) nucleotide adenylyltransferase [Solobacterium sp.]
MRVLYFGGAFNPPTRAHIELADEVRRKLGYDRVLFMPTKYEYIRFEEGKDFAYPDEMRLDLLRKIARNRDWMIVSDYEIRQEEQPRTYHTLQALKEQYELKLLIGTDWLKKLETGWTYIREICREFGIIVMERDGDCAQEIIADSAFLKELEPYLTIVTVPDHYRNLSSSMVRRAVSAVREGRHYIANAVPEEIVRDLETEEL